MVCREQQTLLPVCNTIVCGVSTHNVSCTQGRDTATLRRLSVDAAFAEPQQSLRVLWDLIREMRALETTNRHLRHGIIALLVVVLLQVSVNLFTGVQLMRLVQHHTIRQAITECDSTTGRLPHKDLAYTSAATVVPVTVYQWESPTFNHSSSSSPAEALPPTMYSFLCLPRRQAAQLMNHAMHGESTQLAVVWRQPKDMNDHTNPPESSDTFRSTSWTLLPTGSGYTDRSHCFGTDTGDNDRTRQRLCTHYHSDDSHEDNRSPQAVLNQWCNRHHHGNDDKKNWWMPPVHHKDSTLESCTFHQLVQHSKMALEKPDQDDQDGCFMDRMDAYLLRDGTTWP